MDKRGCPRGLKEGSAAGSPVFVRNFRKRAYCDKLFRLLRMSGIGIISNPLGNGRLEKMDKNASKPENTQ